ncbi:hypothetical protein OE88DRAFT_1649244 [Heliocybe sulcata]|uniref:Uncharacterized protein n=1 Tax=Heliocybe sulcata TaxID=5364 RepID=A0A5C3MKZ9_9AGAM|nr:hypothetical protein OE88DRAFT_1649244 [Heliocybe sulcata]
MDFVPGAEHAPPMPLMAPPGVHPHVNARHLDMYIGKPVTLTGEILTTHETIWILVILLVRPKLICKGRSLTPSLDKDIAEFMGNALFLADMCQDPRFKGSVL